jgi:uncharacterized protein (TIGR02466 family)
MDIKADRLQVFPTDVQKIDWPKSSVNQDLKNELWKKRALDPEGVYRSNSATTWHSQDNVFTTCGSAGEELAEMFNSAFIQYAGNFTDQPGEITLKLAAWAMMYSDRGYATIHTHPNCHFSGVYYVDAGEQVKDEMMATSVRIQPGSIEFVDTRGTGNQKVPGLNLSPAARIAPKCGRMLCFPSWLPHFTHPVVGNHVRIAISCNATVIKFEQKE